jgi:MFS transporter, OFA family, oxalate/formate antiporter
MPTRSGGGLTALATNKKVYCTINAPSRLGRRSSISASPSSRAAHGERMMQPADSIELTHPSSPRLNRTDWSVLAASVIGLFFGSVQIATFGVFVVPFSEQLNWTFMEIGAASASSAVAAFFGTLVVGRLSDRFGAHRLIILSMSLFGVLFTSLSLLTAPIWVFYTLFAILGLIGAGTSIVPHASLISHWFTMRRGLALGVMMCGTGAGVLIWPIIAALLLNKLDWRVCYALLGGGVSLVGLPVLLLFLKNPRQLGGSSITNQSLGLGRREALRSGTF